MKASIPAATILAMTLAMATTTQAQEGPVAPSTPSRDTPASELDDVLIEGRRGLAATTRFVRAIAPPIGDRGLARWNGPVCVGVLGMQADAARMMADRISDWAHSLGVDVEAAGCDPNILVVATDDGNRMAQELVATRPRQFRLGVAGADRGAAALADFQHTDRLVRWWHVALPINPDTERPAVRMPGEPPSTGSGGLTRPADFGPTALVGMSSRLTRRTRDDLQQAIVVVDIDALDAVGFGQLADYVSMVALAHIDMAGQSNLLPSILNLFDPAYAPEPTLTDWDRAFLKGLYSAEQRSPDPRANASEVADVMRRELEQASAEPAN